MSAVENVRCLDSAAYVLGVLPAGDRAAFAEHLPGCRDCQGHIGEFAGLLPLLELPVPSPALKSVGAGPAATKLASGAGGKRFVGQRSVRWAAGLLVAAAVALGLFAVTRLDNPSTATPVAAMPAAAAAPLVRSFPGLGASSVRVSASAAATGSAVSVLCSGALDQSGTHGSGARLVSLWVWTRSGDQVEVTAWTDMQGSTTIAGRSTVAPADIAVFELRGTSGEPISRVTV